MRNGTKRQHRQKNARFFRFRLGEWAERPVLDAFIFSPFFFSTSEISFCVRRSDEGLNVAAEIRASIQINCKSLPAVLFGFFVVVVVSVGVDVVCRSARVGYSLKVLLVFMRRR